MIKKFFLYNLTTLVFIFIHIYSNFLEKKNFSFILIIYILLFPLNSLFVLFFYYLSFLKKNNLLIIYPVITGIIKLIFSIFLFFYLIRLYNKKYILYNLSNFILSYFIILISQTFFYIRKK